MKQTGILLYHELDANEFVANKYMANNPWKE
jgi:hypothetical protein